ncbi:Eco57I restriction-modification methylase domain-containing protein [Actinokineospora iranica]|uniref:site-specific DNA-methyltransferase (adenine-specific) n=1 Tax=Actinokineospora iranica TaxID=1271860 RepID=A0A1G6PCW4_9PSEU|nr:methyltransferase domain-containing protein [Actinokineospora iranica]SDC77889.1 TaqI-like C-terminal specificity domain-containing protein [Actinokineospora iranica]
MPTDTRKRLGAHYTPAGLARFLARRVARQVDGPVRVLDPACGDGELLAAMAELAPDAEFVGFDLDADAVAVARERLPGARIEQGDFTEIGETLPAAAFDVVITNPPYVRTQVLGGAAAARLSAKFGLRGRIDLTHPFVAMAPRLLRPGGVLGLLCSNRFLTTRAGANVRELLGDRFAVREVFDLGDTRLFDAAVLPAVVVAVNAGDSDGADSRCDDSRCDDSNSAQSAVALFASAYQVDGDAPNGDLFDALTADADSNVRVNNRAFAVSVGTLARGTPDQPWRLSTPDRERRHLAVRERTWRTLGDLARIRVGIKTTADPVFISDQWDRLPPARRPEPELLRPLLTHEDVCAWRPPGPPRARVLYPYLDLPRRAVVDLANHPRAAAYLNLHRERLASRHYLTAAGREWFEIWVPHRPTLWRAPKIVFPDISPEPRFTVDRSGAVVNGDCYWISVPELGAGAGGGSGDSDDLAHLVLGVANSEFGARFYDEVCGNRLYAGRRRWITQYVARLPLPDPATPAAREIIRVARLLAETPDQGLLPHLERAVRVAFGQAD